MRIIKLVMTCLWFLLVSRFTSANEANMNCLRSIKSQVEDPNGYLSSWVFHNVTEGSICMFNGVSCWNDKENRVMSIELPGYGLKGEFPHGINQCYGLTNLNLSGNNFIGVLPSNIASLVAFLTTLDLSYNQFSGEIPAGLSNITYLNILMLQGNQFTGQLPPELASLQRLRQFSAADNQLIGPVPKFDEAMGIGEDSFANNTGLCGLPMDLCIDLEEEMIRFGMIGAALFAPVGAFLGWFFLNDKKEKRGELRRRS
ncbi:unnamed protein product [Eruca vesicaria subsp. sativa]|uniref:Leucine-rich repeat-containing N-terminal plant-type domain-containing protein n=1 Tax=Eruca vesicaria subsp. sativa TaxID=29727 RepID=A0ABC8KZ32_ERUVS|nr:unnamed protein product [Eruca vesicaria subsp. sativa]